MCAYLMSWLALYIMFLQSLDVIDIVWYTYIPFIEKMQTIFVLTMRMTYLQFEILVSFSKFWVKFYKR